MKKTVKLLALILALTAIISLCACASASPEAQAAAGTYTFYAVLLDDYYVDLEDFDGRTTTLDANGGGSLDWGDDNQGEITNWTIDGENVSIKAGVSDIKATIKDGILTIDFSSESIPMSVIFVKDGADTSSMPVISSDEYVALYE